MQANELMDLMRGRRSVRKFLADPVPDDHLERMIDAAAWAPSGSNSQNWHFVAVRSPEIRGKMAAAVAAKVEAHAGRITSARAGREYRSYSNYYLFFAEAPLVIAVVKKPYVSLTLRIMERYDLGTAARSTADIQGPSAAIENLLLMAHTLGYGTCWMTGPLIARQELEELLDIRQPDSLMALIPVGKPAHAPPAPARNDVRSLYRIVT